VLGAVAVPAGRSLGLATALSIALAAIGLALVLRTSEQVGEAAVPVAAVWAAGTLGMLGGAARRLARLEQARVRLVSQMSHDLRSPLCVIKASAWALRRGEACDDRLEQLATIDAEVDRAATLVDDLIALGRIRASAMVVQPRPTDVGALVASVARRRAALADDAGVSLAVDVPAAAVLRSVDPTRLEQVVANLVENAIEHAGSGGSVRVAFEPGEIDRVVVEDDGPGIAGEDLPLVFEPFYRGRGRPGGAGLGLAIVRELVVAHGGTVSAERRPEGGARLVVALPHLGLRGGEVRR
jgi:signal transduction histidine kinase